MREIKFRGKVNSIYEPNHKQWVYGSLVQASENCFYIIETDNFHDCKNWKYHLVFSESVGQFTDHVDINEQEIFHGDRIQTVEVYNEARGTEEHIYEVIWEDHGWVLKCETKENNDSWLCFLSKNNIVPLVEWKVIGNIHDNPQILT